ncbi:M4 family metallopeptidase [Macrococcus equi]|uniref:M4 family metallopeptidase n=1 Tax=Macrococcus equi TaxID=3395462 RepID=UPI0039BEA76A
MTKKFITPILASLVASATFMTPVSHAAEDTNVKVTTPVQAIESLKTLPNGKKAKKFAKYYNVTDVTKDALGYTHYTLQPKVHGKLTNALAIKVHTDAKGKVVLINGDTNTALPAPVNTVSLSKAQAIDNAFTAIHTTQAEAKNMTGDVVKSAELTIDTKKNIYIYNVELITTTPAINNVVVSINAENGHIENVTNKMENIATTGLGLGVVGSYKSINITNENNAYLLVDTTHTGQISTYAFNNTTKMADIITDTDKTFNAADQRAAVDAHYYAGRVYNYYKNVHNRDSYNNLGSAIPSIVHVNSINTTNDYRNNAGWAGDKMIYGDGDGTTYRATSGALDVVAHEITHGVTASSAKLAYSGQSGALNESISDTFGYFNDPTDWWIGEDIYTPAIPNDGVRSISNPELNGMPTNMSQYVNTTADNGGIHTNMGIPNKAAYYTITAIGKDKAEKVYYRALTTYLTSNATFADAKQALTQAAQDLYGATVAAQVTDAWNKVGV